MTDAKPTAIDIVRWAERGADALTAVDGLTPLDKSRIVVASQCDGTTLPQLASAFGRSEDQIAAVLRAWVDTRAAAKHLINVHAAELATRMIAEADPAIALDILERVDVVRPKKSGGDGGKVTVILNGLMLHGVPGPAGTGVDEDVIAPLALEGQ